MAEMSSVERLLNQAISLVLDKGQQKELEHISTIEGEDLGWYFWLTDVKGVYEFVLHQWEKHAGMEKTTFLLKYYPDPEDEVFKDFSCAEQIVRMSSCFEDELVDMVEAGENDNFINETIALRFKGIPKLEKRCFFDQNLFLIGKVLLFMNKEDLIKSALETQTDCMEYSEVGTLLEGQDNQGIDLIKNDEICRKVNGLNLCQPFYDFLVDTLFGTMLIKSISSEYYSTTGLISYKLTQGSYHNEYSNEIKQIELTNHFKEGIKN